jgi:phytoene synthase
VGRVWTERDWQLFEADTRAGALRGGWDAVARASRIVLRTYSTSFFLVTRFLPPAKRAEVEVIYAAVRFPDEIVDTFPLPAEARYRKLDHWAADFARALRASDFDASLKFGGSPFAAAFAEVVRRRSIPPHYYESFLQAMRADVSPRAYTTFEDLIDNYVYGSAVVVGYFLTYVYGSSQPDQFQRAMRAARSLGIALQITNFVRDVAEDERRGRLYLPLEFLDEVALTGGVRRMAEIAEEHYANSARDVDAFAEDSRVAIRACIDVYRRLNHRIAHSAKGVGHRETVPIAEKFAVLPNSKYWRVPLAWAGLL